MLLHFWPLLDDYFMRRKSPTVLHSVAVVVVLDISWLTRGTGRQRGGTLELSVCTRMNLNPVIYTYLLLQKNLLGLFQGRSKLLCTKRSKQFSLPLAWRSACSWVMLQGALLAAGARGVKAETKQTAGFCLKTFFPDTRDWNLSWLPWNSEC